MRYGINLLATTYQRLKAQPRNLLAIGILISIVSLGPSSGRLPISAGAAADSEALISLYADGQQRLFSTDATTVSDVLARAGVKLKENDLVEPSVTTPVPPGQFNINVYRARPVTVVDGHQTHRLRSAYQSPRLLALAAGLVLYPEDRFRTEVITDIVDDGAVGEKVIVTRAKPINVKVDGQERLVRTHAATAGEALQNAGVVLGAKDTVSVDPATQVTPGMSLSITRVSEAVVTLTQTLPRTVKTIPDPNLLKGQSAVQEEGSDGQKTLTYRINYKDGVETSREVLQVVKNINPVTRVIVQGTKTPDDAWAKLRMCEAGGDYTRNSGNNYYGAYQFNLSTWQSNGGTGYPHQAPPAVQDEIAKRLYARRGASPWPICGRFLL